MHAAACTQATQITFLVPQIAATYFNVTVLGAIAGRNGAKLRFAATIRVASWGTRVVRRCKIAGQHSNFPRTFPPCPATADKTTSPQVGLENAGSLSERERQRESERERNMTIHGQKSQQRGVLGNLDVASCVAIAALSGGLSLIGRTCWR